MELRDTLEIEGEDQLSLKGERIKVKTESGLLILWIRNGDISTQCHARKFCLDYIHE